MENINTNKIKVLLIEDDEDDYVLTSSLLSEIGEDKFALDWVTDYNNALEKITSDDPDISLLDYRLGAHTGLELLRDVRSKGHTVPIILLTGQSDKEIDVEAMRAGASDYLVKGQIDASLLERSIRYALEQRRIEEERVQHVREQEARAQAEAANRAKDDFLAMVSHELRTPLNAMLGWVQILRSPKSNEQTLNRAVEAIERSAKLQSKFIEDLLDVTRIANDSLRLEMHAVELAPLIEFCINTIKPSADAKNIQLEINYDNFAALEVSGDSDRLQQVINNLLSNAVKFTPEGGRIEITLQKEETNAAIIIKDTGIGISSDFLPYIFDRYRQAETPGKRHGGLGLGLAIAYRLIELHEGSIKAESPGSEQGSIFTIKLPLISSAN